VAGNDGKVDRAARGDLAHAAGPAALDQAREELGPGGIAQGLEEGGIEQVVDGPAAGGGLGGGPGSTFAYLRHRARIGPRHDEWVGVAFMTMPAAMDLLAASV
jgi:hypothetical protein